MIDPCGNNSPQEYRDNRPPHFPHSSPAIAFAAEHLPLDQHTDDLFKEQRVAVRSFQNQSLESIWKLRDVELVAD
jgi:hypothetical protein